MGGATRKLENAAVRAARMAARQGHPGPSTAGTELRIGKGEPPASRGGPVAPRLTDAQGATALCGGGQGFPGPPAAGEERGRTSGVSGDDAGGRSGVRWPRMAIGNFFFELRLPWPQQRGRRRRAAAAACSSASSPSPANARSVVMAGEALIPLLVFLNRGTGEADSPVSRRRSGCLRRGSSVVEGATRIPEDAHTPGPRCRRGRRQWRKRRT